MSPIYVKVSGAWQEVVKIFRKVSGVWELVTENHVKVSGNWEPCYIFSPPPYGVIIFKTNATSPGNNWLEADGTLGTPDLETDGRFLRVGSTALQTGGATTHTDTGAESLNTATVANIDSDRSAKTPTKSWTTYDSSHSHLVGHTHIGDNSPPSVSLVPFIGGTLLPSGVLVLYSVSGSPSWGTENTTYEGKILGGASALATAGGLHSAAFTGDSGDADSIYGQPAPNDTPDWAAQHHHNMDHTHSDVDITPASVKLRLMSMDADTESVPPGVVFPFTEATIPAGYTDITAAHTGRFIYISSANMLLHVGADTHVHTSESFNTGGMVGDEAPTYVGPNTFKHLAHTHTFDHGHDSVSHVPIYKTVKLIKKD